MKTDITVVLDRSGSMGSVADDVVGGFNNFLREQQDVPGECNLTLVQFDDKYQIDYKGIPIKDVKPLILNQTYSPRGMTALLDAIGRSINSAKDRLDGCSKCNGVDKVLFLIQTDGLENASREFTLSRISEMVRHQRDKHDWDFVFIGADIDAWGSGQGMGFSRSDTVSVNKMDLGKTYTGMSRGVTNFRNDRMYKASNFTKDMNSGD